MVDAFSVMNVVGLVAFAVVGSLKAADADLDLFGVAVLGVLTALGGGTMRDVLVGRTPASLQSVSEMSVAVVGVGLAVFLSSLASRRLRDHPTIQVPDAIGLAAFAATGALVGFEAGLSPYGVVVLATLTAVGGGSLADLLLTRVPAVLREDFYATPALLGGVVFWLLVEVNVSTDLAASVCAGFVLTVRLVALRYGWSLPRV
ncbi:trimeric intracellular cation channel family protein [Haloprofundus sp. MHR1]|uniref:trimeric intracellular cation channel family protein n=1 Tax=Haloprofundus sp. MHR1 TaxID=2572921 RepID=UPI0010BEE06B|nr:trimeric intracellular cation channel family protein [Haloprofundus sp. MHR1]QCJ47540.1 trimeric intracellular cation channel family protein [Haloprofundus sp. MHR1]